MNPQPGNNSNIRVHPRSSAACSVFPSRTGIIPPVTGRLGFLLPLLAVTALWPAPRPRYGGTLRIETIESPSRLEAIDWLAGPVFETLVRFDDKGEVRPLLAVSWSHDTARKRWVFTPRPNVKLHNGAPWTPAPESLAFPDDRPLDAILRDLARPRNAIIIRQNDGAPAGTGPFRVESFEPSRSLALAANEDHWAGRPYLDRVEFRFARALRDQALDLEAGQADLVEVPLFDVRRLRERGARLQIPPPSDILALVFDPQANVPDRVREALALSLDRKAIHGVLLQRQGEPSAALLPQWLSGYAFVFPADRDAAGARDRAASPTPLPFDYDRQDPLLRTVAERIALNASEAGLTLRPGPGGVHLRRLRIATTDARTALEDLAASLGLRLPPVDDLYEAERSLLADYRLIPIVHLPAVHQLGPRVMHGSSQLAAIWLDDKGRP